MPTRQKILIITLFLYATGNLYSFKDTFAKSEKLIEIRYALKVEGSY